MLFEGDFVSNRPDFEPDENDIQTGFPYSKSDWEKTIDRLNSEKEAVVKARGKTLGPPTVKPPPPSVMQGEGAADPKAEPK